MIYNVIEVDARITSDNKVILHHDATITDAKVNISDLTLDQIEKITETKVLTLEQLLQEYPKTIIIDMKTWNTELINQIGSTVELFNAWNNVIIGSFHPFAIWSFKQKYPLAKTCYMWCKNCIDYFDPANDEISLPNIINYKPIRVILDRLLYTFSQQIAILLKVDLVGIEDIDITPDIVNYFNEKNINVYTWKWKLRESNVNIHELSKKYNISICD
jgi:glycerophosphoryl diester phosphodiesterase